MFQAHSKLLFIVYSHSLLSFLLSFIRKKKILILLVEEQDPIAPITVSNTFHDNAKIILP